MRSWYKLKNPIYPHPEWSVKDVCVVKQGDVYFLFFSAFFEDRGQLRSHLVGLETKDFETSTLDWARLRHRLRENFLNIRLHYQKPNRLTPIAVVVAGDQLFHL